MNKMLPMSTPIVREVKVGYSDEKPRRHKWYEYLAKIGTHNGTVVWVADKPELSEGDKVWFTETNMSDKGLWVKYLSDNQLHHGTVTMINKEPRAFFDLV